jgi:membrane protein YdbS with pleckstrin-like domain
MVLLGILTFLLSSCTFLAGGVSHWPASLVAVLLIVSAKLANDRFKVLAWPMEFLLAAGVTMIVVNLVRLAVIPMSM